MWWLGRDQPDSEERDPRRCESCVVVMVEQSRAFLNISFIELFPVQVNPSSHERKIKAVFHFHSQHFKHFYQLVSLFKSGLVLWRTHFSLTDWKIWGLHTLMPDKRHFPTASFWESLSWSPLSLCFVKLLPIFAIFCHRIEQSQYEFGITMFYVQILLSKSSHWYKCSKTTQSVWGQRLQLHTPSRAAKLILGILWSKQNSAPGKIWPKQRVATPKL